MKTLFWRIGSDKAGTVSLADFVQNNCDLLKSHGILTCSRNSIGIIDYFIRLNSLDAINVFDSHKYYFNNNNRKKLDDDFLQNYDTHELNDIFLTTETLWGRLTRLNLTKRNVYENVKILLQSFINFFSHHKIKIIVHIRRADIYIESLYSQYVKRGGKKDILSFISNNNISSIIINSQIFFKLLSNIFGVENIIIRQFDINKFVNNDLIDDLLSILSRSNLCDIVKKGISNERLHRLLIDILPYMNNKYGKLFSSSELISYSKKIESEIGIADCKYILDYALRNELIKQYCEFYDTVNNILGECALSFTLETYDDYFVRSYTLEQQSALISWLLCKAQEMGRLNLPARGR